MRLPAFVALPAEPAPAQLASLPVEAEPPARSSGPWSLGETVHVVSGTPDGTHVFCLSSDAGREGWLQGGNLKLLAADSAPGLPLRSVVPRTTLGRVHEDWQDRESSDNPSPIELQTDDLVQIMSVKGGWGYGWPLEFPSRRGWFPLAAVDVVESSFSSLLPDEPEELPPAAAASLQELLRSVPPPPRRPAAWHGELPAVVKADADQAEHLYHEELQRMASLAAADGSAQELPNGYGAPAAAVPEVPAGPPVLEVLPEDCYPLVVCKQSFVPPRGTESALLAMEVGDLVRVTSSLDAAMYHGFLEGSSERKGWVPKSHVSFLEDPLNDEIDQLPAPISGPPPLPEVPDWLLQQAAMPH